MSPIDIDFEQLLKDCDNESFSMAGMREATERFYALTERADTVYPPHSKAHVGRFIGHGVTSDNKLCCFVVDRLGLVHRFVRESGGIETHESSGELSEEHLREGYRFRDTKSFRPVGEKMWRGCVYSIKGFSLPIINLNPILDCKS